MEAGHFDVSTLINGANLVRWYTGLLAKSRCLGWFDL